MRTRYLGLWLALAGCGATPGTSLPLCNLSSEPCDIRETACQERLLHVAACLREDDPGSLPVVHLLSEAEALSWYAQKNPPRPVPDHWANAMSLLELVTPDAYSSPIAAEEFATSVAGFYHYATKELFVIDHDVAADDARSSDVLVHELVHYLQDRDLDLDAYFDGHSATADSAWAARAMVEGEAELHAARFTVAKLGLDLEDSEWDRHFQARIGLSESWMLAQPSRYTAAWGSFPYAFGQRRLGWQWELGGEAALLEDFASTPTTTYSLFAVEKGAPLRKAAALPIARPTAPPELLPRVDTRLGALSVYLAAGTTSPELPHTLALAWRGDRLSSFASADGGETVVVWTVVFAEVTNAADFVGLVARRMPRGQFRAVDNRVTIAAASSDRPIPWAFGR